jgi:hypothetical protein
MMQPKRRRSRGHASPQRCRRALRAVACAALFALIGATAGAQPASVLAGAPVPPVVASDASTRIEIRRIDDRHLEIIATFPPLEALRASSATVAGAEPIAIPGIDLPGFARELSVAARSLSIESVESVDEPGAVALAPLGDAPQTNDAAADRARSRALRPFAPTSVYPSSWAEASPAGLRGGTPISILRLYPFRFDPSRRIVLAARRLRIVLTIDALAAAESFDDVARTFVTSRSAKERGPSLQAAEPTRTIVAPDGREYKIFVDRDGVVRLTARRLLDAGVPLDAIDTRTLRLVHDGVEQPMLVIDRGDNRLEDAPLLDEYVEFFGERKRALAAEAGSDLYYDQYTSYSVYFLTWGGAAGKRIVEESGALRDISPDPAGDLTDRSRSFTSTLHFEENLMTVSLGNSELNTLSDRYDRQMWGIVRPNEIKAFPVLIPAPNVLSSEPVRLRAALRSTLANDDAADSNDATVRGVTVFVQNFRFLQAKLRAVAHTLLSSDSNAIAYMPADRLGTDVTSTISVSNEYLPRQSSAGDINVNWFELTYPRFYRAVNDSITFATPTGLGARYYTFRIRGFSTPDIRIYRRGISRIASVTIAPVTAQNGASGASTYDAIFQVYVAGDREQFVATSGANVIEPIVSADRAENLRAVDIAADYVVIVDDHSSQYERLDDPTHALRRFAAQKERDGHSVRIVRATDIYDEFNGGAVSPSAIKAFLAYAWRTWSTPPRFALIFGAGDEPPAYRYLDVADSMRAIVREHAYVPSVMLQTVLYGATPCDYLLGCISGRTMIRTNVYEGARQSEFDDLVAEISVGRVAVDSYDQIASYVDKLIEQENDADNGEWRNRSLFIAGWEPVQSRQINGAVTNTFRFRSEPYRFMMGDEYQTTKYWIGSRSVVDMLNSGAGLVTYLGHGGGGQWESQAELSIDNAESVHNRRHMPPILSLTCFTGAYNPDQCLLGRLLVSPNGGAIVALGTPGFGWLNNNGFFAEAIFSILRNPRYRDLSFGETITLAKALYVGTYQQLYPDHVPTVAAMYSILGDPSLGMPATSDTTAMTTSTPTASPGAAIGAIADVAFVPTRVSAHLFDTTEMSLAPATATVNGSRVTVSATIPGSYDAPYAGLRFYASDDAGHRTTGSIRFPGRSAIAATVQPASPLVAGSDALFEVEYAGIAPLDSVWITLRYASPAAIVLDSIGFAATPSGAGRYRIAPVAGSSIEPGAILDVALPNIPNVSGASVQTFYVEGGADPAAFAESASDSTRERYGARARFIVGNATNESMAMIATSSGARLRATAYNWGDRDVAGVPYRVEYDSAGTRLSLGSGSVDIRARDSVELLVDVGVRPATARTVYLTLAPSPGDRWLDAFDRNNIAHRVVPLAACTVRSGVGFTLDGATTGSFVLPRLGELRAATSDARADGLVSASTVAIAPVSQQRWRPLSIGIGESAGQAVTLVADAALMAMPVTLTLTVTPGAPLPPDATIIRYDATTKLWRAVATTRDPSAGTVAAVVEAAGTYAVARVDDATGPRIQFAVEGQFFLDSSSVAGNSRFGAVISDESGIDPETVGATLDGAPLVMGTDVVWLDSTITPTSAGLRVQKQMSPGRHALCVSAADRVGNATTACATFDVDDELSLRLYGNFPNPFASETFIAYEIRGASLVDAVEVKVFSTAGKLVRTFRFPSAVATETRGLFEAGGGGDPTAIGYHEVWWDGLDDQGREVANGVYFYRVRVTLDDRVIEELNTIARIR